MGFKKVGDKTKKKKKGKPELATWPVQKGH